MYNGIGLQTARGSGTNGYVQRNLSFVKSTKEKINFRSEADLVRLEAESQKGPNPDILEHARKRALELKSAEMEDVMREQGYTESEVREKVAQYRAMLMEREQNARPASSDPNSHLLERPNVRETHAVAEAQQQKNARLKEAFGISEFFVEGSSLDPDRRTKEEAARQAHLHQEDRRKRRHEWVSTPSPSPTPATPSEQKDRKDKKKKKKRTRDRSSSRESRKKRKSKKSKRSRSSSPKKKKRSREKKKKGKTKKKRKSSSASSSSSSPAHGDGRKSVRRRSSKKSKSSSNSKQGVSSINSKEWGLRSEKEF